MNKKFITSKEAVLFLRQNNQQEILNKLYCKNCGDLIIYPNTKFYIQNNKLYADGYTGLYIRSYNNIKYNLCICNKCLEKKFDRWKYRNREILRKTAKYTQYAFNVSEKDFKAETKRICGRTKESFIKKYRKEIGLQKWKDYCNKQSITNTFEYKHKKYGMSKEDFNRYNASRAVTKENLIKRHGKEKAFKIWKNYIDKQRETCSKEYFIKKYGKRKGLLKYNNFSTQRTLGGGYTGNQHSNIADEFCQKLAKYFKENKIYTHSLNTGEYVVKNLYRLDYYDKTLNIAVEFYGDFWHYNPKIYNINENSKLPDILIKKNIKTIQDLWKHDKIRIKEIEEELNTKVFIIWESDYKENKILCIENLIKEIKNYSNNKSINN